MLAKQIILARYNNKPEPFKKIEFPTLKDIALEQVAKHFELYPHLSGLSEQIKHQIISKASKSLPVTITYNSISDETYWKQACETKWKGTYKSINILKHGQSYKIAYMENYLGEYIKQIKSVESIEDKEIFIRQLKSVSNWIFTLNISQAQCHIDISLLLQHLPCLTNLTVVYGVKTKPMEYEKDALGMKLSQAAELAEALTKYSSNLLTLQLPSNLIDDDILRYLMPGINMNISIIELNLSHNNIDDEGVLRISQYLLRTEILLKLDLSNNKISYKGSRYLGKVIRLNKSLEHLNLALNSLDDKAGQKLFADLATNKQLLYLNLSANLLFKKTAQKLSDYLSDSSCTLQTLIITNNNFTDDVFESLKSSFTKNTSLINLDIQCSKFSKVEMENELSGIIVKSRLKYHHIPYISKEEFLQQQQEALLLKEKLAKQQTKQQLEEGLSPG